MTAVGFGARARGGGEESRAGLERRKAVHFEEVDVAIATETEVDAAHVADVERLHDATCELTDARQKAGVDLRRATYRYEVRGFVLQVVVVDVVAALVGRVDQVLDGLEDAVRADAVDERNGDVLAADVLLDDQAGGIDLERLLENAGELDRIFRDGLVGDAFGRAFEVRLHDHGKYEIVETAATERLARHEAPAWARHAVAGEDLLRERLVERDRQRVRVAARIRKAELVEERGVEGFACATALPLGGVEDQVGAVGLEPRDEAAGGAGDFDSLHVVTTAGQCVRKSVDRLRRIELGFVDGGGELQVVREGNFHSAGRILRGRAPAPQPCARMFVRTPRPATLPRPEAVPMWRGDQMTTPESGTETTSGTGQEPYASGEVRLGAEKLRPILVITSGVQGVGKTTFAEALAQRVDAVVVSSDVLRVEVAGVVLKEGMLDYYTEFGRDYVTKLYGALLKRAHAHLSEGKSVICDASFERKEDRAAAAELARTSGAAFLAVECLCWETVRYHRLRRRLEKEGRDDLLDETWRVYVDHARRFEEFGDEVPPESHLVIETSLRLEDWIEYVADRAELLRRVPADEVAELAARVSHPPRILIVDDDPQFLDVLESILDEDGFEVSRAGSGSEAIASFDAGTFDLVVTDKRMPGGSGVDLARHIKAVKPSTPIIMVSAFGTGDLGDPKDEGIFKFLRKPVRLPALMGAVEEALASEETPRPKDEDGT